MRIINLTTDEDGHKSVVMAKRKTAGRRARSGPPATGRTIGAAGFKARCLELMDKVRETGVEYTVTKHGVPVARLVPYSEPKRTPLFGSMKGTILKYERPFEPIDAAWDVNRD
jgi:prevent-host-death family protein